MPSKPHVVNVENTKRFVAYKKISAFLGSYDGSKAAWTSELL